VADLNDMGVAVLGGNVDRRRAMIRDLCHIRSPRSAKKNLEQVDTTVGSSQVESSPALRAGHVDVGMAFIELVQLIEHFTLFKGHCNVDSQ